MWVWWVAIVVARRCRWQAFGTTSESIHTNLTKLLSKLVHWGSSLFVWRDVKVQITPRWMSLHRWRKCSGGLTLGDSRRWNSRGLPRFTGCFEPTRGDEFPCSAIQPIRLWGGRFWLPFWRWLVRPEGKLEIHIPTVTILVG